MRGKTERLGSILEKVLLKKGVARTLELKTVSQVVGEVLGEEYGNGVRVGGLKKGKLVLSCKSPSIGYEIIGFKRNAIIAALEEKGIKVSDLVVNMED